MISKPDPSANETLFRSTSVGQNWLDLRSMLADLGLDLDLEWKPRQFSGGYGNLNYLIMVNGEWAVLRRPPEGPTPKGANDMAREHRMLSALHPVWPLAPKAFAFVEDVSVLGAPFLISEYRQGLPLLGVQPLQRQMTAPEARHLSVHQMQILASLHSLDLSGINVAQLGRTSGFVSRTLLGWSNRMDRVTVPLPDDATRLFEWLSNDTPQDVPFSIIHNDFKLDNVIVDPETLEASAVLDWDMSTLGDPIFDLATLLTYWVGENDPEELQAINLTHSATSGALSRHELVEAYFEARERNVDRSRLRYMLALAYAKLGVVCAQLFQRYTKDPVLNARNAKFGPAAPAAFALGRAAAAGEII